MRENRSQGSGVGGRRAVERLSRGQSHDVLTRLENCGLTPALANAIVSSGEGIAVARAMALVAGWRYTGAWPEASWGWPQAVRSWWAETANDLPCADDTHLRAHILNHGIPDPQVSVGELVERALQHQALFYRPPSLVCPMWAFAEANGLTVVSEEHLSDSAARERFIVFAEEEQTEGYWYWMSMVPGMCKTVRSDGNWGKHDVYQNCVSNLSEGSRHGKPIIAERIRARAASLEELLIAFACGRDLGWPMPDGEGVTTILRTRSLRGYPNHPKEQFLCWSASTSRPQDGYFSWLPMDVAQLTEQAIASSISLSYFEVERLAPAPAASSAA
ncbi:hypothetical protein HY635_01575 [Candidatus Uhrbacteria bacterium]|nr:hypothetical protein [Candidatus Uhrbacteria bacterium]